MSLERGAGWAALNASWEPVFRDHGAVVYHVFDGQGLRCTTAGLSCSLGPVLCAETHDLYMVAENQAGPSTPTDPQPFVTCEWTAAFTPGGD